MRSGVNLRLNGGVLLAIAPSAQAGAWGAPDLLGRARGPLAPCDAPRCATGRWRGCVRRCVYGASPHTPGGLHCAQLRVERTEGLGAPERERKPDHVVHAE